MPYNPGDKINEGTGKESYKLGSLDELLDLLADNTTFEISAHDLRDAVFTLYDNTIIRPSEGLTGELLRVVSPGVYEFATVPGLGGNVTSGTAGQLAYYSATGQEISPTPIDINWDGSYLNIDGGLYVSSISAPSGSVYTVSVDDNGALVATSSIGADGITGSVQFSNGNGNLDHNSNELVWDVNNLKLGIGKPDPQHKLDVEGDARIGNLGGSGSQMVIVDNNGVLSNIDLPSFEPASVGPTGSIQYSNGAGGVSASYLMTGNSAGEMLTLNSATGSAYIRYKNNNLSENMGYIGFINSELFIVNQTSNKLKFSTDDNTRMTISSDGNVGIGTTDPTNKFEVWDNSGGDSGRLQYSADLASGGYSTIIKQDDFGIKIQSDSSSRPIILGHDNTGERNVLSVNWNKRVGINTIDPQAALHVNSGNTGGFTDDLYFNRADGHLDVVVTTEGGWARGLRIYNENYTVGSAKTAHFGALGVGTGDLTRTYWTIGPQSTAASGYDFTDGIHMLSDGKVGIGTKTPTEKLHVNGIARVGINSTQGGMFLQQEYSGSNIINSLSSNYSNGAFIIGNRVAGKQGSGSADYVATQGNANSTPTALRIYNSELRFLSAPNDAYTVGQDITGLMDTKFIVNSSGDVGIGTGVPGTKLHVAGKTISDAFILNSLNNNIHPYGSGHNLFTYKINVFRANTAVWQRGIKLNHRSAYEITFWTSGGQYTPGSMTIHVQTSWTTALHVSVISRMNFLAVSHVRWQANNAGSGGGYLDIKTTASGKTDYGIHCMIRPLSPSYHTLELIGSGSSATSNENPTNLTVEVGTPGAITNGTGVASSSTPGTGDGINIQDSAFYLP
jgi:hypothetical protein